MPNAGQDKRSLLHDLVKTQTDTLYAAALGLGFAPTDAEEIVQQSFVALAEGIERFEGRAQLRTYLFSILYHKAADMRRKQGRVEVEATDELFESQFWRLGYRIRSPDGPEETALNDELRAWIERCAENLTAEQRMAFYLKAVEDQGTETLCKILDVSPTHLGVIFFRARNRLRDCLEKHWKGRR